MASGAPCAKAAACVPGDARNASRRTVSEKRSMTCAGTFLPVTGQEVFLWHTSRPNFAGTVGMARRVGPLDSDKQGDSGYAGDVDEVDFEASSRTVAATWLATSAGRTRTRRPCSSKWQMPWAASVVFTALRHSARRPGRVNSGTWRMMS
jgi:hypothetical protein